MATSAVPSSNLDSAQTTLSKDRSPDILSQEAPNSGIGRRPSPEDVRVEYAAVAQYINTEIGIRFTVAGFYLAAMGFLAQSAFSSTSWGIRFAVGCLGCLLSLIVWVFDLRSRTLYRNVVQREIDIEHNYWHLDGPEWNNGFFSRQYKQRPPGTSIGKDKDSQPPLSEYDSPRIAWLRRPLSPRIGRHITHSMAFDILYPGTLLFWFVILLTSLFKFAF